MKTLDRIKSDPRVDEVWHEDENGWWVTLKSGFYCAASECHAVHEQDLRSLWQSFRTVEPCKCEDCRKLTKFSPDITIAESAAMQAGSCNSCGRTTQTHGDYDVREIRLRSCSIRVCEDCAKLLASLLRGELPEATGAQFVEIPQLTAMESDPRHFLVEWKDRDGRAMGEIVEADTEADAKAKAIGQFGLNWNDSRHQI